MTAAAVLAAALAAGAIAQTLGPDSGDCPAGTRRVATDDPYRPFRCALPNEPSSPGRFSTPEGPAGFSQRPKCPRGTEPLATPHSLQPYRCVRAGAAPAAPAAAGARYAVAGGLSFEPPSGFRLQDAWKDDVPTIYLELEGGGAGKPTSITITRVAPGRGDGETIAAAIVRDKEWQGAKEIPAVTVAGSKARATEVAGGARSVYLPDARESYYAFVYSTSEELYRRHLPEFERLLKSVRLEGRKP
jgi:hypothetical protein